MKIKRPFNFAIGLFCMMLFIIDIVTGKDAFVLSLGALATVVNLACSLIG